MAFELITKVVGDSHFRGGLLAAYLQVHPHETGVAAWERIDAGQPRERARLGRPEHTGPKHLVLREGST